MKFLIGADPEIFVTKNGEFISAHDMIPGDKKAPHKVDLGAVQVDGTALEFNINPTDIEDEFVHNIQGVMGTMLSMARQKEIDVVAAITPVAKFSKKIWSSIPDSSKMLGCDPDFNIQGMMNPNPGERLLDTPLRTASGHIHIGWTTGVDPNSPGHFEDCKAVAEFFHNKRVFEPKTRAEKTRIQFYGMNGSFRPKPYGVELRAPSNLWLQTTESIREMFQNVHRTFSEFTGA